MINRKIAPPAQAAALCLDGVPEGYAKRLTTAEDALQLYTDLLHAAHNSGLNVQDRRRLEGKAQLAAEVAAHLRQVAMVESARANIEADRAAGKEALREAQAELSRIEQTIADAEAAHLAALGRVAGLRESIGANASEFDAGVAQAQAVFDAAMKSGTETEQEQAADTLHQANQAAQQAVSDRGAMALRLQALEGQAEQAHAALMEVRPLLSPARLAVSEARWVLELIELDEAAGAMAMAYGRAEAMRQLLSPQKVPHGYGSFQLWFSAVRRAPGTSNIYNAGSTGDRMPVLLMEDQLDRLLSDLNPPDMALFAATVGDTLLVDKARREREEADAIDAAKLSPTISQG